MSRNKRSLMWSYFVNGSTKKIATCKICNQNVLYSGSTTKLWDHFWKCHVESGRSVNDRNDQERKPDTEDSQYPI